MTALWRSMMLLVIVMMGMALAPHRVIAADLSLQQMRDVLSEAQQAYDRGIAMLRGNPSEARSNFQAAAQKFQLVADNGLVNGLVFYNLANAQLQAGDVGRAILNYRRAQQLIPSDPRVQSNLDFARTLCKTPIAASGQRALTSALLRWHDHTATRTRFNVFITTWLVFWCALLLRMARPAAAWTMLAAATGVIWMALGISVAVDVTGWGHRPAGVVLADNVTVRKGNGSGFEPQLAQTLGPGVEFDVLERRGDWLNMQLPNGSTGWIEANQADLVP